MDKQTNVKKVYKTLSKLKGLWKVELKFYVIDDNRKSIIPDVEITLILAGQKVFTHRFDL